MKSSNGKKPAYQVELLSPAGSWDSLVAAVANGADAVYLGTRELNARANARNFSLDELARAVEHCHRRGARVYLTMNILVKDHELPQFFDLLSKAYTLGVDGVIIQHVSLLESIKAGFPGLAVFLSTQAAIGNAAGASLFKSADRIILPRELTLAEVKQVIASGARAEVFVHGALCFSYSGLCLFSSFVSDRSGNRGLCAQLCRQTYNGAYPLSTKELCLVARMPELIQAGITGFKIEGRMRTPLYVAVATRLYRKAIDSFLAGDFAVPAREMAEIEVVFNREFTEGFMFGDRRPVSPERPMNRGALLGVMDGGEMVLQRPVAVGDGVGIWTDEGVGGAVIDRITLAGERVDSASPGDRVNLGFPAKDGTRVFLTSSSRIRIEPDFSISRQAIPAQDRKAVKAALPPPAPPDAPSLKLLVKAYTLEEARKAQRAGADIVFYDIFAPDFPDGSNDAEPLGAYVPRVLNDEELAFALARLREKRPGAVLAGNIGLLARRKEVRAPVYVDYSLNAFNYVDVGFFRRLGATPVLSPELSLEEMMALRDKSAAVFCHGDVAVMNTLVEMDETVLTDQRGEAFPVRKEGGYRQIMNSHPFGLFNEIRALYAAGFRQFFIDRRGRGAQLAALYRTMLYEDVPDKKWRRGHTSGHLYRPVR